MKKIIFILCAILAGLFVILSILDHSDYAMEKQLWRAQKKFERIAQDPTVVPDREFQDLSTEYRQIMRRHPKSALTPRIYIKLGLIAALKKDYAQARKIFEEAIATYPQDLILGSEAAMQIGKTYERENNPAAALAMYQRIIKDYPMTPQGMGVPLYIGHYLNSLDRKSDAREAYHQAVVFYKKILQDNPKTEDQYGALQYLATTYFTQQNWKAGVDTLADILLKFSRSPRMDQQKAMVLVKTINTVSVANLNSYEIPVGIYRQFIQQNPGHPFNPFLEKTITALQGLQEKNVGLRFVPK